MRKNIRHLALALGLGACLAMHPAQAENSALYDWQPCPDILARDTGKTPDRNWDLTLSPYTHHWTPSEEHKNVFLVALDRRTQGNGFCGMAAFTNSFGQPSLYAYAGQQWNGIFNTPQLFTKVSFGLIWGYRGKHKNDIGANALGIAPAIIPSLGWAASPKDSAQIYLLGTAGVLFAYVHGF